jgi:hypothetical protein
VGTLNSLMSMHVHFLRLCFRQDAHILKTSLGFRIGHVLFGETNMRNFGYEISER